MKKYRLIINYPSLFQKHKIGDIVYYNSITKNYVKAEPPHYSVSAYDVENYPDCWELIEEKKPLFTTDDGVDVVNGMKIHSVRKSNFDRDSYIVDEDYVKEQTSKHPYVYFFHESNADEYIWRNKRVFSYNDLRSWDINGGTQEEALKLAKERSKE